MKSANCLPQAGVTIRSEAPQRILTGTSICPSRARTKDRACKARRRIGSASCRSLSYDPAFPAKARGRLRGRRGQSVKEFPDDRSFVLRLPQRSHPAPVDAISNADFRPSPSRKPHVNEASASHSCIFNLVSSVYPSAAVQSRQQIRQTQQRYGSPNSNPIRLRKDNPTLIQ